MSPGPDPWLLLMTSPPLSPRQADVARALLLEHPVFEPPNPPIGMEVIARALGVRPSTVKEHLRRIRSRHPELYAQLVARRRLVFARYHAAVGDARRERSRRWGKARWAVRYRREHGCWPWDAYRTGVHRAGWIARARLWRIRSKWGRIGPIESDDHA